MCQVLNATCVVSQANASPSSKYSAKYGQATDAHANGHGHHTAHSEEPVTKTAPQSPSPLRPPFQRAPAPAFAWPSSESDSDSNLSSENTNVGRFWLPLFQEFTALRQRLMHCAPAGVSEKICVKLLQGAERRLNLNLSSVSAHEVCPFTEPAHCPSAMFCWRSDPHQERKKMQTAPVKRWGCD